MSTGLIHHANYVDTNAHNFGPQHINYSSTLNASTIYHNDFSVINQQKSAQPDLTMSPQQNLRSSVVMNQQRNIGSVISPHQNIGHDLMMNHRQSVQPDFNCYSYQQAVQQPISSQQQVHGSSMQPNQLQVANQPTNFQLVGQDFTNAQQGASRSSFQHQQPTFGPENYQSSRQDFASLQNASFQSNQNHFSQNTNQFSRQGACLQNHHCISQQQNVPQQIHNSQYDYQQHYRPVQAVHGYPLQGNDMQAGKKL